MIGQIASGVLGAIGGGNKGGEAKAAEGGQKGGGGPLGKLTQIINTLKGAITGG